MAMFDNFVEIPHPENSHQEIEKCRYSGTIVRGTTISLEFALPEYFNAETDDLLLIFKQSIDSITFKKADIDIIGDATVGYKAKIALSQDDTIRFYKTLEDRPLSAQIKVNHLVTSETDPVGHDEVSVGEILLYEVKDALTDEVIVRNED